MLNLIVGQVPSMLASEDWRRRHAALMAVSSAGEGCHKQMEQLLDQVVSAVLNYLTDPVSVFESNNVCCLAKLKDIYSTCILYVLKQ